MAAEEKSHAEEFCPPRTLSARKLFTFYSAEVLAVMDFLSFFFFGCIKLLSKLGGIILLETVCLVSNTVV